MIKKLFLAIFFALPFLASAQIGAGQWIIHPYFVGASAQNCIDAGNKVYYLSSGSLYCYDKASMSNNVLTVNNLLNGGKVNQIYYNYNKQYLVVAYTDCNIDILKSDGEVINVPAIKDVVMHKAKAINDVNFCNGKMYVATSFGYIVLDEENFSILETRNYQVSVTSVAEVGEHKFISYNTKDGILYCGANEQVEAIWRYKVSKTNATFVAGVDATSSGGKKLVKTPITISCDSVITVDNIEYVLDTNSVTTITIPAGYRIFKIEMIGSDTSSPVSNLKANTGTYSTSDNVGTWTGEARTIKLTANEECKVSQIIVHYMLLNGKIYPINDSKFFLSTTETFSIITIDNHTGSNGTDSCSFTLKSVVGAAPVTVQPYPAGFVASFGSKNYYYTILPDASKSTKVIGNKLMSSQEEGNWWALGADGLTHVVAGVEGEHVTPNGVSISTNAYWSTYDPMQQRVLVCRTTDNKILAGANSGAKTEINSYDGTYWRNITPANAPNNQGNLWIVASPNEPNTYYYCCRLDSGICKVQNDVVVAKYKAANSPYATRCAALQFDSKGNLWIAQSLSKNNVDAFAITPENQLQTAVDSSLFVINDMGGACYSASGGFKRITFGIGAGDTKAFTTGDWGASLVFWTSNDDLSVKQFKSYKSFIDQDEKKFSVDYWRYIKPDNDSILWIGTETGIISLDPRDVFNEDFRINHIKVTKNEGKEVSGWLLDGQEINCIDVDANNNKWIATNTSGLYFVSPDGSEIYKHFDYRNSPIPSSDQIYSVSCNRATNSLIVVTPYGVLEYLPDVTPGEADYSNVYAYPELVEPDFTDYVTIKGLMANSNVVITDSDGNVVKTMVSNGGIAIWDACDENGVRVSTGLYKVYASQGDTSTTGEPLTKIAIIK